MRVLFPRFTARLLTLSVILALSTSVQAGLSLNLWPAERSLLPGQESFLVIRAGTDDLQTNLISLYQVTLTSPNSEIVFLDGASDADFPVDYVFKMRDTIGIEGISFGQSMQVNDELLDLTPDEGPPAEVYPPNYVSLGIIRFKVSPTAIVGDILSIEISANILDTFYSTFNGLDVDPIAFSSLGGARIRVIPEPASVVSLALGCLGLAGYALKRRRAA